MTKPKGRRKVKFPGKSNLGGKFIMWWEGEDQPVKARSKHADQREIDEWLDDMKKAEFEEAPLEDLLMVHLKHSEEWYDDKVDEWHDDPNLSMPLQEFLDLNDDEFKAFMLNDVVYKDV